MLTQLRGNNEGRLGNNNNSNTNNNSNPHNSRTLGRESSADERGRRREEEFGGSRKGWSRTANNEIFNQINISSTLPPSNQHSPHSLKLILDSATLLKKKQDSFYFLIDTKLAKLATKLNELSDITRMYSSVHSILPSPSHQEIEGVYQLKSKQLESLILQFEQNEEKLREENEYLKSEL